MPQHGVPGDRWNPHLTGASFPGLPIPCSQQSGFSLERWYLLVVIFKDVAYLELRGLAIMAGQDEG